jgi:hypothetical protein
MNILPTPEVFRPYRSRRNRHDHNYCVAEAFHDAVGLRKVEPETERIYLGIFWANSYHEYVGKVGYPFRAIPQLQKFLDSSLSPSKKYFTVARCDEGLYENIPDNLLVFGAGKFYDVAIPLTSAIPYTPPASNLKYLATFAGCIQCGGPDPSEERPTHSANNPDGIGTQVRRAMQSVFAGVDGCKIDDVRNGGSDKAWRNMTSMMSQSKFCLAPRGYAPTSFRLYEAMALGSIPVYISDEFILPFDNNLDWDEFCIFCSNRPAELKRLPQRLKNISESWRLNALIALRELYASHFSLDGTCQKITHILETELH